MNVRVRAWVISVGLLGMVAAPVLAVLDHNLGGGDRFGPETGDAAPMPVYVEVLFFGGVALLVAVIIATALAKSEAR